MAGATENGERFEKLIVAGIMILLLFNVTIVLIAVFDAKSDSDGFMQFEKEEGTVASDPSGQATDSVSPPEAPAGVELDQPLFAADKDIQMANTEGNIKEENGSTAALDERAQADEKNDTGPAETSKKDKDEKVDEPTGTKNQARNESTADIKKSADDSNKDARIMPTTATFDKANPGHVVVTMELNGKELVGLRHGESELKSSDCVVLDNKVTIRSCYLIEQPVGETKITFDFSSGHDPVLTITITDTSTPISGQSSPVSETSTPAGPVLTGLYTTTDGTKIRLTFDREMAPLPPAPAGFTVTVNKADVAIQAVNLGTVPLIVELTLSEAVRSNDDIEVAYTAGTVTAQDRTALASFPPKEVKNNSNVGAPVPEQDTFFNNLNQLTEVRFPSGKIAQYHYDLNGNLVRIETIEPDAQN